MSTILTYGKCLALSLKESEEIIFQKDDRIKAFKHSQDSAESRKNEVTGSFLPELTGTYSKGYQSNEWKKFTNSSLEVKMNLQNPVTLSGKYKVANAQRDIVDLSRNTYRFETLYDLRTHYFKIKMTELQLQRTKANFAIFSKLMDIAEKKFNMARIQSVERDRLRAETMKFQFDIQALETSFKSLKDILALKLSHPISTPLTTELPKKFAPVSVRKDIYSTEKVKRYEAEIQKSEGELRLASSQFLPNIYLSAKRNENLEGVIESKFTAYTAGLVWTLAPQDYFKRRATASELAANRSLLDAEKLKGQTDLDSALLELESTLSQVKSGEAVTAILQDVSKKILDQYQSGYVNYTQYYDDFSRWQREEDSLLSNRYKAVEIYARLAKLVEDDSYFPFK